MTPLRVYNLDRIQCMPFSFESQLKRHGSTHKDDKSFTCAIHRGNMIKCDVQGYPKSFPNHHYLCDHKNTKHGMPYECKYVLDSCLSVSVFEIKHYKLDRKGKKRMPICRMCNPPPQRVYNLDQIQCTPGLKAWW